MAQAPPPAHQTPGPANPCSSEEHRPPFGPPVLPVSGLKLGFGLCHWHGRRSALAAAGESCPGHRPPAASSRLRRESLSGQKQARGGEERETRNTVPGSPPPQHPGGRGRSDGVSPRYFRPTMPCAQPEAWPVSLTTRGRGRGVHVPAHRAGRQAWRPPQAQLVAREGPGLRRPCLRNPSAAWKAWTRAGAHTATHAQQVAAHAHARARAGLEVSGRFW